MKFTKNEYHRKDKNEYAFILIINIIIENLKFNYLND